MTSAAPRQYLDLNLPYYFSDLARRRQEQLRIGDYVKVSGLGGKYEIMDIFPRSGSVRVREVGGRDEQTFPWSSVSPWKRRVNRSAAVMHAIGNWLFGGSKVFRLSEPDRMLKQRRVHWDTQTCDVEDEDGKVVYHVPWDELEFLDPSNYHFAGDE